VTVTERPRGRPGRKVPGGELARVALALPRDLLAEIDKLRGPVERATWIRNVLEERVRGGEAQSVREVLEYAARRGLSPEKLADALGEL
jgi:hypothetical protein